MLVSLLCFDFFTFNFILFCFALLKLGVRHPGCIRRKQKQNYEAPNTVQFWACVPYGQEGITYFMKNVNPFKDLSDQFTRFYL